MDKKTLGILAVVLIVVGVAGLVLSSGYSGQIWYHTWHGNFIREV